MKNNAVRAKKSVERQGASDHTEFSVGKENYNMLSSLNEGCDLVITSRSYAASLPGSEGERLRMLTDVLLLEYARCIAAVLSPRAVHAIKN